ncbi:hypothetical protein A3C23_03165 [Candidatus Roizmanbacteria bacterium RIFCSPHIGHO2_02_FULL_37_13b]|uniref:N-(5'-phosphoribosyl)anthranilate isomerase n=1 Tax=Candidatus Roizmanbacteria bacterium RIFCSPLOWO2_02_FULL_36_11 TaxID=1802071 RepID=A0A1F7JGK2_9BACT|nr:MAG: hypothetical protein A3C23_03165 [Candidatus Roizmanbacteria bacterium RIFCSPHIGHO2_02_FULL_37_13b]OGK54738.1 MAG: hypothetical protein A3H78_05615 [Candidatus Roizmanbacteria bacterium RIFCSPLOWO2_02_FULL_36_11]
MNVKVKICGIRTAHDAKIAVSAGADFLGFNFIPKSKRYINPKSAKTILSNISVSIQVVGVFQNQDLSYVNELIGYLSLDLVQLHGKENIKYIKNVKSKVIKMVGVDSNEFHKLSKHVSFFLLDRKYQGRGKLVDPKKARLLSQSQPLFIAGGLTPENVGMVVRTVRPIGVDVASGIETNSLPSEQKIINFISNAKAVKL